MLFRYWFRPTLCGIQTAYHIRYECSIIVLCSVLVTSIQFSAIMGGIYPHSSGLFHCHWNIHLIAQSHEATHWKRRVFMMPKLSSMAAPWVATMATSDATSDDEVGIMMTLKFQYTEGYDHSWHTTTISNQVCNLWSNITVRSNQTRTQE